MINTNLSFLHWFLNLPHGNTVRNPSVKLNFVVLNSPKTMGDKIKLVYIHNSKVDIMSEIWFLRKINGGACKFIYNVILQIMTHHQFMAQFFNLPIKCV